MDNAVADKSMLMRENRCEYMDVYPPRAVWRLLYEGLNELMMPFFDYLTVRTLRR